ncbi:hypothetical protein [Neobacillus notoginsengisoli]|uniref:hypothetical protein n=1 Tax=Neobacillus notoginsengisoli TaxID=1578198 RepID=UPI001863FF1A|nr:hypothetical protein [Neobacillus notoginsengisoli]
METTYSVLLKDGSIAFRGTACDLREVLEEKICEVLDFNPMLQENEDDGHLQMYIHTDSYEDLSDEEVAKLTEIGITEDDSLEAICQLLNTRIEVYSDEQIASCTICNKQYHDSLVNKKDFVEEDICENCLPKHPFRKDLILLGIDIYGKVAN